MKKTICPIFLFYNFWNNFPPKQPPKNKKRTQAQDCASQKDQPAPPIPEPSASVSATPSPTPSDEGNAPPMPEAKRPSNAYQAFLSRHDHAVRRAQSQSKKDGEK